MTAERFKLHNVLFCWYQLRQGSRRSCTKLGFFVPSDKEIDKVYATAPLGHHSADAVKDFRTLEKIEVTKGEHCICRWPTLTYYITNRTAT